MRSAFILILFLALYTMLPAQTCTVQLKYDIPSDCKGNVMTMKHDAQGKDFLYVACKDAGLKIYSLTSSSASLVKTIPASALHNLHVMSLSQQGNYLYLALGNSFAKAVQSPGMAIVDVSLPAQAAVAAVWSDPESKCGAGIVESDGQYAYLGAMSKGLMIFDVGDKKAPKLVSQLIPDLKFPEVKYDAKKINARGMALRDDKVYLCYDAGGLRVIDVKDKKNPRETGKYSNPAMNGKPRAYNNIVLDDTLAYVAVDYCGIEVISIKEPAALKLVHWWNPWKCEESGMKWFKSDGHCNEIVMDHKSKLLFVSTGKSDMYVLSVKDPLAPGIMCVYGGIANEMGTWGVSRCGNEVYLSYICTLGIPFKSNWSGVKVLKYEYKP
ncbi:MAG: hypothetical protein AB1458_05540 [Bacteroidota bacterium]